MELTVRVHFEEGAYGAEALELPGCFASDETLVELKNALAEAIGMVLAPPAG
jgi:predicted RNase H-like HicB family nuclease